MDFYVFCQINTLNLEWRYTCYNVLECPENVHTLSNKNVYKYNPFILVNVHFNICSIKSLLVVLTVIFPDIAQLQAVCKKRTLDGNHIEVNNVAESDCIIVRGFSPKTTSGTIEYYFDNKRRSGVEGVVKTEMNTDQGYCVVYFQDPKSKLFRDHFCACPKSGASGLC